MSELDEERLSCGCSKTKCVQRHCSCFRARYYCSENCQCLGCRNTEQYEAYVEEQFELILKKNPHAFDPKVAVVQEATQIPAVVQETKQVFSQSYSTAPVRGDERLSDVKGCSCQEIKCSNMNCECFKFMVGCTEICKCEGCINSFGIKRSSSKIKAEIGVHKIINSEQNDAGGITSEAIKMEDPMQSEDASRSYPNKCQRIEGDFIIKSEQDDAGGIASEAIKTENSTQSEDALSSDPNKRL